MSDLKSVLVLAGGLSSEREVSLRSGSHVTQALRRASVEVQQRDADSTLLRDLAQDPPSVVLPLLHGAAGEDGTIKEVLELAGIPYIGAPPAACRGAFDKPTAKAAFTRAGLLTPASVCLPQQAFHDLGAATLTAHVLDRLGLPLFVKPRAGGSALGVSLVETAEQLPLALVCALGYHPEVLIEQCVRGTEIAVAVADIDGQPTALPPVEIDSPGLYDYSARYTAGAASFHAPARLTGEAAAEAARAAVAAHRALGLRHLSRTDAIVTADGQVHILETNVAPGMTPTSTYPIALEAAGYDLGGFLRDLAADSTRWEPVPPGPAAASLAESGAAQGRLLPGADDPTWETVPLHLRQRLRGLAHQLVSPPQGPLTKRENRHLLSAVRAASRMRMTGAHWTLLLTTGRESFGSRRSQRAQLLYAVLEQVAAQHAVRSTADVPDSMSTGS